MMQLLIHLKNVINISVCGRIHFIQCSVLRGAELKFIANNINLKLINGNENVGMQPKYVQQFLDNEGRIVRCRGCVRFAVYSVFSKYFYFNLQH